MYSKTQPLVRIVTPVYNGEKYLDECIASVLKQEYTNWEYIILNNCSTDSTPTIAEKFASKDSRIRIYTNSNLLPMFENWNRALAYISPKSKYCKVVHADDWMFPQCISSMVDLAECYPSLGIVGSFALWNEQVVCDGLPFPSHFLKGPELCRVTLLGKVYPFWSPSSIMIRSDLIRKRNPFYNESYPHADVAVCYELLQSCDFGFVHQVLTFIRNHDDSMTSSVQRVNAIILYNLDLLTRYGPIFLTHEEFVNRLKFKLSEYYRFLAKSFFQLRDLEFWKYHKVLFCQFGYTFNTLRVAGACVRELVSQPPATLRLLVISFLGRIGVRDQ